MTNSFAWTKWVIFLFITFISPILGLRAQSYSLEVLSGQHKYRAPAEVQDYIKKLEPDRCDDCFKDLDANKTDTGVYFSLIKMPLSSQKRTKYYLVFPSNYCSSFFGAHAIAYWIIRQNGNHDFTLLYSGQSDGIVILKSITNGCRDIRSQYGGSSILLKFDTVTNSYSRVDP